MMGATMTSGEQLHRASRTRFWRTLAIAGAGGVPMGFAVGFGFGISRGDIDTFWNWAPDWLIIILLVVSIAGILYGSWRFHRSIDEVELTDNLWSSWAAYGVYAMLFPTWWVLGKAGLTSPPNDWVIYLAALLGGLSCYGWRKWRAR